MSKQPFILGILLSLSSLMSCFHKTVDKDGGIRMTLEVGNSVSVPDSQQITGAIGLMKARMDYLGYKDAKFTPIEGTNHISCEIPSVFNSSQIEKFLLSKFSVSFWETYENNDLLPVLLKSNKIVYNLALRKNEIEDTSMKYPLFKLLIPNINTNTGEPYDGACIGNACIKDTARINEYLNNPEIKLLFPKDLEFCWSIVKKKNNEGFVELIPLKIPVDGKPLLSSSFLKKTDTNHDIYGREFIWIEFDEKGSEIFKKMTRNNISKTIAITLNDSVIMYPVVQSEISGGNIQIVGNFTLNEAKDMAFLIGIKPYPAAVSISKIEIIPPAKKTNKN